MTTAITFLLVLTLTGSPAATLTCVAACASAARDMDMSMTMGNDSAAMLMPAASHVADAMESCGTMSAAIPFVRNEARTAAPAATALAPLRDALRPITACASRDAAAWAGPPLRHDPPLSRVLRL